MNDTKDTPIPATKAVAIKREAEGDTPHITAKGRGYAAKKILDIAFAEGVKVRQDKDLTDLLDAFEIESPVPLEALQAVSIILERVYAENRKMETTTEALQSGNPQGNATENAAENAADPSVNQTTKPIQPPLNRPFLENGNRDDQ